MCKFLINCVWPAAIGFLMLVVYPLAHGHGNHDGPFSNSVCHPNPGGWVDPNLGSTTHCSTPSTVRCAKAKEKYDQELHRLRTAANENQRKYHAPRVKYARWSVERCVHLSDNNSWRTYKEPPPRDCHAECLATSCGRVTKRVEVGCGSKPCIYRAFMHGCQLRCNKNFTPICKE